MGILLGEFHTMVSDALGRSTSLDTVLKRRVELAARWLERNYTFMYMKQWKVFTAQVAATYPYIINVYDLQLKGIELIRRRTTASDGSIQFDRPLTAVHPADRETRPTGNPESYWLNGVNSIILNSVPDEDMTFEAHVKLFTKWNKDDDNFSHWLLDNATELLLARSLMMMSVRTRDPDHYAMYKTELDLEMSTFNVSEEDLQAYGFVDVWEPLEFATDDQSLRSA